MAPGPPWLPIGNLSIPPSGQRGNRSTYWTSVSPYSHHRRRHHRGRRRHRRLHRRLAQCQI